MKDVLKYANIVICSYLGGTPELQEKRVGFHKRQRMILSDKFPEQKIVSVCSGYPAWAKSIMKGFECDFVPRRLYKLEIHNRALKHFYNTGGMDSMLILGDDVVPTQMKDIDLDPWEQIAIWLNYPDKMPAPCMFFSCKGVLRDSFYMARHNKGEFYSPTQAVTGWAIMVRSDLKVMMRKEEIANDSWQFNDDSMLRYKCAAMGKECLKCNDLFFETFQGTSSDKNSLWYRDRDQRNEGIKQTHRQIMKLWPWLLRPGSTEDKLRPVWLVKGDVRKYMIFNGLLKEGNHSLVPTKKLQPWWEQQQAIENRPGLLELVSKQKRK